MNSLAKTFCKNRERNREIERMGIGKKGTKVHAKNEQGTRKDRRSATGMSGEPKKRGHGGKFTWVGPGGIEGEKVAMEKGAIDAKDPNFDEEEEEEEESLEL